MNDMHRLRVVKPRPLSLLPEDDHADPGALIGYLFSALFGALVGWCLAHLPGFATTVCSLALRWLP